MNYKNREKVIAHSIFLLGSIIVLYPFFSILFLALSEPGKRISGFTVPSGIYFDNFIKAWTNGGFSNGLFNSFVVVFGVVSITIFCSTLAAYAFEKLDILGVTPLFALLLIGLVLPYESIVISLYYTMKSYNLSNTYWSLILPQIGLSIPFSIFWLRASFKAIPNSLSEAAMIEGADRLSWLAIGRLNHTEGWVYSGSFGIPTIILILFGVILLFIGTNWSSNFSFPSE